MLGRRDKNANFGKKMMLECRGMSERTKNAATAAANPTRFTIKIIVSDVQITSNNIKLPSNYKM